MLRGLKTFQHIFFIDFSENYLSSRVPDNISIINTLFDRKTFDNKNSCIDEVRKYRDIHPGYHGGDPKYRDIHLGYHGGDPKYRDIHPGYHGGDPKYRDIHPNYHGGDPKYRDIYVFTPSSISFLTTLLSSAIK